MGDGASGWRVVDLHVDLLSKLKETGARRLDGPGTGHIDLERARRGGVAELCCSLYTPQGPRERTSGAWSHVNALLAIHEDLCRAHPEIRFRLTVENGNCLEGDLERLDLLVARGLRLFQPVHNGRNELGDGAVRGEGQGLTPLGREAVQRAEALGIVPDVAHIAPRGFDDILDVTRGPVVASHANARAICDHPRNLTDEQLRAIAGRGGVVGLCFYPPFLSTRGLATVDDVLRHAEHMLEVMGPSHVAIGSDFDGIETTPLGLEDVSCFGALAEGLLGLGLGREVVAGIMGANASRLLSAT